MLYQTYGVYRSRLLSFAFEGSADFVTMQSLMSGLRHDPPTVLAGLAVEKRIDYLQDESGLPKSNVLRYFLGSGAQAVVRPSGTQPKLKVYLTVAGASTGESDAQLDEVQEYFNQRMRI